MIMLMGKVTETRKFYIEVNYDDETNFGFDVEIEGADHEVIAHLMMITRGTLVASSAYTAYCYNQEGFEVCAYRR